MQVCGDHFNRTKLQDCDIFLNDLRQQTEWLKCDKTLRGTADYSDIILSEPPQIKLSF